MTAPIIDHERRLAALAAELAAEREAHAKTKAGLRELVEESGGDNLPCVACGFGHSANCDKGYETELIERAERAEAIVRGLRKKIDERIAIHSRNTGSDASMDMAIAYKYAIKLLDELEGR